MLKSYREALHLPLSYVAKFINDVEKIENKEREPNLNELIILSKLYLLPIEKLQLSNQKEATEQELIILNLLKFKEELKRRR